MNLTCFFNTKWQSEASTSWDRQLPAPLSLPPAKKSMLQNVQFERPNKPSSYWSTDLHWWFHDSGTKKGGPGMIIARNKIVFHRWHAATGKQNNAYLAEETALDATLEWVKNENGWHNMAIVCDWKALVEATSNPHQPDLNIIIFQQSLIRNLCSKRLLIVWVSRHCNIGAMSWRTQKPSRDQIYRNLPSCTWTKKPRKWWSVGKTDHCRAATTAFWTYKLLK